MGGLELRTVGCVEPDGGDGRRSGKGHRTAETGQAEDETQRARKPHWGTKAKQINIKGPQRIHLSAGGERTNRYGSGSAIDGRLCAGTWSRGSRRRG